MNAFLSIVSIGGNDENAMFQWFFFITNHFCNTDTGRTLILMYGSTIAIEGTFLFL